ncbi:MAG TPA: DNA translocase FtsK 4TM domain-containing protein [Cyclobacteriaceae bacterium]
MAKNTYKSPKNKKKRPTEPKKRKVLDKRFRLAFGFLLLAISIFLFFAFISYLFSGKADQSIVESVAAEDIKEIRLETKNIFGWMGAVSSYYFIFRWFGLASFVIPPFLFILSIKILSDVAVIPLVKAFYFTFFVLLWVSASFGSYLIYTDGVGAMGYLSGAIGYELALFLDGLLGWGLLLLLFVSLAIFIIYFFNIDRLISLSITLPKIDTKGIARIIDDMKWKRDSKELDTIIRSVKEEVENEENEADSEEEVSEIETWTVIKKPAKKVKIQENKDIQLDVQQEPEPKGQGIQQENKKTPPERSSVSNVTFIKPGNKETPQDETHHQSQGNHVKDEGDEEEIELVVEQNQSEEEDDHQIVENVNYDPTLDLPNYKYPDVDLLNDHPDKKGKVTKEELERNKDNIVETLINFKIGISSIKATIGPTVTLYEIIPEAGVKISKIKNLEDDIALSLSALGIRIIAPIPGKGTIGIEVPNRNRELVDIKSVLNTEKFMESDKELPVVLGKTISNDLYITDLTKMPHLLVAGATGQGKSVGINVLLSSLLYKKHPSQLKFVLVDPKKVELTLFNKIERHFLAKLPDSEEAIITDTKKVVNTLNSLCIEMDSRYDLLKEAHCRNLKEYNKKFISRQLNPKKGHRFLPYIVLVIDELSDLMMTAGKEIETPIARIAQLARAVGIHLIVATQRPSVNVITGIIKANFPARLSYRVTSKVDSRTILDMGGAEQLIGMGDMLLSSGSEVIRMQCPFIDTDEVERVCEYIGSQRGYHDAYLLPEYVGDDEGNDIGAVNLDERDSLFDDAARLIVMHQQGSTSLIQRKMKLGYNRAGRLIDQLEAAGIVGSFEGSKAREVLISDEYSLEQLLNNLNSK